MEFLHNFFLDPEVTISSHTMFINPLLTEFFFSSFFGTYPNIGSFRLPTHSRDGHRKIFLMIPSFFKIEISAIRDEFVTRGHKGLMLPQRSIH